MQVIEIITSLNSDIQTKTDLAIKRIESLVKEYCNRSDIPSALNFLIADMVIDYLNLQDRATNPDTFTEAKTVREGDTTVELSTSSMKTSEASLDTILADYKSQLNKHRKMRW